MPPMSHIVRFKIVSVECNSMPNGQQYTIYYRRGDTRRSTPCYIAQNGTVDFSTMPEGAAVIHFKSGSAGRRYAPKFIQLRIEEYTRGAPRRTVGETEVDCSLVLTPTSERGSGIVAVNFRMYGLSAKVRVAILVYPERSPPLTFDGLVVPSSHSTKGEEPLGEVKHMGRGEAMALLISLETMLERRKKEDNTGSVVAMSKAERRLKELEDRRKALTGSEGMATTVVTARCQDAVEAQFVALARKFRSNYVGATAAYLRQLALSSGVPLTDGGDDMDESTTREQLARTKRRIEELQQQLSKLEEEQAALGRIQHKTDVTQELCANLDKVAAVEGQKKLLEQSESALLTALNSRAASANTPLLRDVKEINERVKVLTTEQEQLQAKVRHMTAVAAGHTLSWARAKNPPAPEPSKTSVDDLFSKTPDKKAKAEDGENFNEIQRKQLMSALEGLKVSAPPPHSAASASSSSGHRTPRDVYAPDLPSMGDFGMQKEAKKPQHADPLKPSGLAADMFSMAPKPKPSAGPAGLPSAVDFSKPAADERREPQVTPMFDFGAVASKTADHPVQSSGFTIEPAHGGFSFGAASPSSGAPAAVTMSTNPTDPYYDDIDDYTVPEETNMGAATIEFTDGFGGFGVEEPAPAPAQPERTYAPGTAPRPKFNFGSGEADDGPSGGTNSNFVLEGAPTLDFGGGSTSPSQQQRGSTYSGLPSYNFGS